MAAKHLALSVLLAAASPTQAASTLVWVASQEANANALAEELQALAGPIDLLALLTQKTEQQDVVGQALGTARLAWRQVQLETVSAALDQAQRAIMARPQRGDAGRAAEMLAYRAALEAMNFQTESARKRLIQAAVLGLSQLPPALTNSARSCSSD